MKENNKIFFLASFLTIVGIMIIISFNTNSSNKNYGILLKIYRAAKSIPEGEVINESDVEVFEIPKLFVEPGAFENIKDFIGRKAIVTILKNSQITSSQILDIDGPGLSDVIPNKRRGVAVEVSETNTLGGNLMPGDRVDIDVIVETGIFQNGTYVTNSVTIKSMFENITVVALDQIKSRLKQIKLHYPNNSLGNTYPHKKISKKSTEKYKTISLYFTKEESRKFALASYIGTIVFRLRNRNDHEKSIHKGTISAEDLGINGYIPKNNRRNYKFN